MNLSINHYPQSLPPRQQLFYFILFIITPLFIDIIDSIILILGLLYDDCYLLLSQESRH